ncbi:unnamed protein product, partial [Rotaria magnacalcarata]
IEPTNIKNEDKKVIEITTKHSHTSPILHRLLTSPTKINENSQSSNQKDPVDNDNNNKSPQYQPRYSPFYVPETNTNRKLTPKDTLIK